MNPDGKEGPSKKIIFSCTDCIYLSNSVLGSYSKKPYKCHHEDMLKYKTSFELMNGDISSDKITPIFCPFLMKKLRNEKLKELNSK